MLYQNEAAKSIKECPPEDVPQPTEDILEKDYLFWCGDRDEEMVNKTCLQDDKHMYFFLTSSKPQSANNAVCNCAAYNADTLSPITKADNDNLRKLMKHDKWKMSLMNPPTLTFLALSSDSNMVKY